MEMCNKHTTHIHLLFKGQVALVVASWVFETCLLPDLSLTFFLSSLTVRKEMTHKTELRKGKQRELNYSWAHGGQRIELREWREQTERKQSAEMRTAKEACECEMRWVSSWHWTPKPQATNYIPEKRKGHDSVTHALFIRSYTHSTSLIYTPQVFNCLTKSLPKKSLIQQQYKVLSSTSQTWQNGFTMLFGYLIHINCLRPKHSYSII